MERTSSVVVQEGGAGDSLFDDDGRIKRTGTVITASAHIITAIIGSGALSLAWAVAQLGSLPGSVALLVFSVITLYTSILLTDCYRSPEGTRNYSYMDAVRTHLGGIQYMFCGLAQYATLIGLGIGYVITTALSIG
nr:amino acid permease 6-like [Ipomoea batatas]